MSEPLKLCINCAHLSTGRYECKQCTHPRNKTQCPVTGNVEYVESPWELRQGGGQCTLDGIMFEPKKQEVNDGEGGETVQWRTVDEGAFQVLCDERPASSELATEVCSTTSGVRTGRDQSEDQQEVQAP